MKKWIITWNVGYGDSHLIIEADTKEAADQQAFECAREEFENSATYGAEEYSEELAEELGVE